MFSLPDGHAVTGLGFGFWSPLSSKKETIGWVVATTRERIYEMQGQVGRTSVAGGKGGWAEEVFRSYRDTTPSEFGKEKEFKSIFIPWLIRTGWKRVPRASKRLSIVTAYLPCAGRHGQQGNLSHRCSSLVIR